MKMPDALHIPRLRSLTTFRVRLVGMAMILILIFGFTAQLFNSAISDRREVVTLRHVMDQSLSTNALLLDTINDLSAQTARLSQETSEALAALSVVETQLQETLSELNKVRNPPRTSTRRSITGVEQWRNLVAKYFDTQYVNDALSVMMGESGGNPNAVGKDNDCGLFQHLARYWDARSAAAGWAGADIFDPEANIAVAAWLSKGGRDWGHWTVKP